MERVFPRDNSSSSLLIIIVFLSYVKSVSDYIIAYHYWFVLGQTIALLSMRLSLLGYVVRQISGADSIRYISVIFYH